MAEEVFRGHGLTMLRGGSWNNKPENARAANRNRNKPANRNNNNGFRLAAPAQDCYDYAEMPDSQGIPDSAMIVYTSMSRP